MTTTGVQFSATGSKSGRSRARRGRQRASGSFIEVVVRIPVSSFLKAKSGVFGKRRKKPAPHTPAHGNRKQWTFDQLPPRSRELAKRRQKMMEAFFQDMAAGKNMTQSARAAQVVWLQATGKPIDPVTVWRWARRIRKLGGMAAMRDVDFIDGRNCDHPRARKNK